MEGCLNIGIIEKMYDFSIYRDLKKKKKKKKQFWGPFFFFLFFFFTVMGARDSFCNSLSQPWMISIKKKNPFAQFVLWKKKKKKSKAVKRWKGKKINPTLCTTRMTFSSDSLYLEPLCLKFVSFFFFFFSSISICRPEIVVIDFFSPLGQTIRF